MGDTVSFPDKLLFDIVFSFLVQAVMARAAKMMVITVIFFIVYTFYRASAAGESVPACVVAMGILHTIIKFHTIESVLLRFKKRMVRSMPWMLGTGECLLIC